jgi:hypothetical protein
VYYIYIILGFDEDSFKLNGGKPYFEQAMQITTAAQSQGSWNGWKAFDTKTNRHTLATALTETASAGFHQLWYDYHRNGLDKMAANAELGRSNIIAALPALKDLKQAKPNSVLLQIFADTKLDELVSIYSAATAQEKQEGYALLSEVFPAATNKLAPLKN